MEFNKPVVSIITPAYNCKNTIAEAYNSIKAQTFSHWEWIIIEDHSTDDSFNYIKKIIEGDNRVTLLRTNCNSGAAVARNVGIEAARGRYISFLDADDLWMKNKLELQVEFMKSNDFELTCTNYQLLYSSGILKNFELQDT